MPPSAKPVPIVVFAQVPPPEHGQSRMVQRTLDALRTNTEDFDVHHINARFSETLEDVGEGTFEKLLLSLKYLTQALRLRSRLHDPLLLYVPGPAEWAPVVRDWILLPVLRLFYRRVVFHWHAIGQGEWAHESDRLRLDAPKWLDGFARSISRRVLNRPYASISVSEPPCKDAAAVGSLQSLVVPNGNEDPCSDYETVVEPLRAAALNRLRNAKHPIFRVLFLSHGTIEKGLLDAVEALGIVLQTCDRDWHFEVTFAGEISELVEPRFQKDLEKLQRIGGERLVVQLPGYVSGDAKRRCYLEHEIFLSPSRWESFGLTVVEAMAYGMRIVAAASDGVSGVLPRGHPYLAPVASPQKLADSLHACCRDMRVSQSLGMENSLRQRFLEHFQLKDFSSNLISAFRELATPVCSGGVSPSLVSHPVAAVCDRRTKHVNDQSETATDRRYISQRDSSAATITDRRNIPPSDSSAPTVTDRRNSAPSQIQNPKSQIAISVYLADQNPGYDRSFGISRMSQVVIRALIGTGQVAIEAVVSRSSQQAPKGCGSVHKLPWSTRGKFTRSLTDHFHPFFHNGGRAPQMYYFPKGYLPISQMLCKPSVVTIHDTIIQYDADHYPRWRRPWEYSYWSWQLRHTLRYADRILTVSQSSKYQIEKFMARHGLPGKEITVTYEPCQYETIPQPVSDEKAQYVIHLASREPHKRTAHLVRWWHQAEQAGRDLPTLHLVGNLPDDLEPLLAKSRSIVKRPFLEDSALQDAYRKARALILPSEIEGFGLPALEAYYLGTPVCYVTGTSVEEILAPATTKGGFNLDDPASLFTALDEVLAMNPEEIRHCGLVLRETYASEKVAERMLAVFHEVKHCNVEF